MVISTSLIEGRGVDSHSGSLPETKQIEELPKSSLVTAVKDRGNNMIEVKSADSIEAQNGLLPEIDNTNQGMQKDGNSEHQKTGTSFEAPGRDGEHNLPADNTKNSSASHNNNAKETDNELKEKQDLRGTIKTYIENQLHESIKDTCLGCRWSMIAVYRFTGVIYAGLEFVRLQSR